MAKKSDDYQDELFKNQLELLKIEIDLVDRSIARDETRSQNVKNFAIAIWAAVVTLFIGQDALRKFVIFTTIIPVLFWFLDAWWARLRMGTHVRSQKIAEFINSPDYVASFRERKLMNFTLLDVTGKQHMKSDLYKRWSKLSRIMKFGELRFLYGGLTLFSVVLGVISFLFF